MTPPAGLAPVGTWTFHEAGLAVLTGPGPASVSSLRGWLDGGLRGLPRLRQGFVAVLVRPDGSGLLASSSRWEQSALYAVDGDRVLVGTHPRDLIQALPAPPALSIAKLTDLIALYDAPDTTVFEGIHRVPLGHVLEVSASGATSLRRWFDPVTDEDRSIRPRDAPQLMREAILGAVRASLPDAGDVPIAATLSGGLDSSMVTATAATLRPITVLTHVPLPDTPDPGPTWDASDHPYAAATANHINARGGRVTLTELANSSLVHPLDASDWAVRRTWQPVFNPSNQPWINQLVLEAEAMGSPILLTGAAGNATYSRNRDGVVRDLAARRRWAAVAREVRDRRLVDHGWRDALRSVAREAASPGALAFYRRRKGIGPTVEDGPGGADLPYLRDAISERARAELIDLDPDHVGDRQEWIGFALLDVSRTTAVQGFSPTVWWSDPLSDPEVVSLALRLPEEAWLSGGRNRGLARSAALGLVPDVVRLRRTLGAQAADTAKVVAGSVLRYRELIERFRASPSVPRFLDLDRLEASLARFEDPAQLEWQGIFGRAFAVGQFAVWYEDEVTARPAP